MREIDQLNRYRYLARQYRRDAELIGRRMWWQWLLFIHPDPRLVAIFLIEADKWDAAANALQAKLCSPNISQSHGE